MKKRAFLFCLSLSLTLAAQHDEPYFADVPPCHWAFEAVNRLAGALFVGFPPRDDYLAVNAVWQVFEGLRCEDPSWSLRFLEGAPEALAVGVPVRLVGFELETALISLEADTAEVSLSLLASLEEAGERHSETRQGTVNIVRTVDGWPGARPTPTLWRSIWISSRLR
jgi:hypothetical protein